VRREGGELQPRLSGIRTVFEAAARLEEEGKSVVHFEIGQPDFDTPVHIKNAAKRALDEGKVRYTSSMGVPQLREAIADKLLQDNGIHADPTCEVLVTAGAKEAVFAALLSTLRSGDQMLLPEPAWPHYGHSCQIAGGEAISVPLYETLEFQIDPDRLRRSITPRTRILVINNPHNPTGTVCHQSLLEKLAEIAIEHDLIVLSDEIYEYETYDGVRHLSIAALPGMWPRTLTVNGFSKAFSMTGWRLGYLAGPRNLVAKALRVHESSVTCANSFAQWGALEALRGPQDCVQKMLAEFDRRRRRLLQGLNEIGGFRCVRPRGAFYVFPSIESFGLTSAGFAEFLLRQVQVATVPGTAFGAHGEGFIRIAYSTSYAQIEKGLARIKGAVSLLG
jgi:aspartate/methionine/tyrosine aminotransferase